MSLRQKFMRFLFPRRCFFCHGSISEDSPQPCARCAAVLPWIPPEQEVKEGHYFQKCVASGWYEGHLRASLLRYKFANHPEYARVYAPFLADSIRRNLPGAFTHITWVPVSPDTLKTRGYDQAQLLAQEVGALLQLPVMSTLEKVKNNARQSSISDRDSRKKNVTGVYAVPFPEDIAGLRLLLVDDIFTTGSTMEEAAKTLGNAGAKEVFGAVFCRGKPLPHLPHLSRP